MALVKRLIDAAILLAPSSGNQPNVFAGTSSNTISLTGHRISVRVQNSGGMAGSQAQISIWGLTPSVMNQLSTCGMQVTLIPRNEITITAGDDRSKSTVFIGNIVDAYPDYNNAPDVPFRMSCFAGAASLAIPYPASSYAGGTDVATVLSAIAKTEGWGFENNGVNASLSNPYYAGSAREQVQKICADARISHILQNNTLIILPLYGKRQGGIPLLAPPPEGQMVGYPVYISQGIMVRNIFDPRIGIFGQVQIKSDLARANGTWTVLKMDLALDSLLPKGQWMSTVHAYNPNFDFPIPR